jgi:hypothetical protein
MGWIISSQLAVFKERVRAEDKTGISSKLNPMPPPELAARGLAAA